MGCVTICDGIEANFAMKITDEGLRGIGIMKDDVLCVSDKKELIDGKIYCSAIGNQFFVGRLYSFPDRVELRTENPERAPIVIRGEEQERLKILGMVTGFIRKISD